MTPRRRRLLFAFTALALLTIAAVGSTGCLSTFGSRPDPERLRPLAKASRMEDDRFVNDPPQRAWVPDWAVLKQFIRNSGERVPDAELPLVDPRKSWTAPPDSGLRVTWFGHSATLVEVEGYNVLTDPMWGDRASPSSLVGPDRFHPPPVTLDALPKLDAVVISHDHYDHLDKIAIEALVRRDVDFYVPLGIGSHLKRWGVPLERIVELDWWEERIVPGRQLKLVATPAHHFSGRGVFDRNTTLWASWVIQTPKRRVYFSGDTGPQKAFEQIRDRLGPFDLVMLEVGAYHPSWGDIHLGPDGAVEAHKQLGGGPFLPIHWATFNLGIHDWYSPAQRLAQIAKEQHVPVMAPKLGEPVDIPPRKEFEAWWEPLRKKETQE